MENTEVKTIGKDYTLAGLARYVAAPVITQFALSMLQTLDDSLFLSRYVGTEALAAFSLCSKANTLNLLSASAPRAETYLESG